MKTWTWTQVVIFCMSLTWLNVSYAQTLVDAKIEDPKDFSTQGKSSTNEDFFKYFVTASDTTGVMAKDSSKINPAAILAYSPKGIFKVPISPDCHPRELEKAALKIGSSAKDFSRAARAYFNKCEKQLHSRSTPGLLGLVEFAMAEYHFLENPKIKPITFQYSDGTATFGFIGVKDNNSKRPWVIAKCGVFCSAGESASVNNYMMHLFDESPFNIIFLGNRTGTDYIKKNKQILIGGYLESHDYIEISRWLKEQSPYRDTVDSVHALGISLAGNAAAYASSVESLYPTPRSGKYLDSVMAICPVINLQPTLEDMFAPSTKGEIFVRYSWSELKKVKDDVPEFSEKLNQVIRPPKSEFPGLLGGMISLYGGRWSAMPENSRRGPLISNLEDVWSLNQFTSLKEIDTPMLVWASKDDSIVNNEINTQTLDQSSLGQSQKIGVVNLEFGNHCGFSSAYGYPLAATVLRTWVLDHSPNFTQKRKIRKAVINFKLKDLPTNNMYSRVWFQTKPKSKDVYLNYEYLGNNESMDCQVKSAYEAPQSCFESKTLKIPMSDFSFLSVKVPNSDTESDVLTRYLNSTLTIKSRKGVPVEGTSKAPDHVTWYSYY